MFSFENVIDLPLVWGGIISLAIFLYVLLDGFDLGIGILFPFAPTSSCRDMMMNSIAPFWDGNETWLILGGGGLLAAFPLAYAIIFPAMYAPLILMLIALVFRGVAFEFRFKAKDATRKIWDYAFHFGSLFATFAQGMILGGIVQGIVVNGREFSGGVFDWLSAFSIMTGIALVAGYCLLGATWLIMKTNGETQVWARKSASYVLFYVLLFMAVVSIWVPFLENDISERWFSWPNIVWLSPIPLLTAVVGIATFYVIRRRYEFWPFFLSIALFAFAAFGLAVSLYPWIVPYQVSLWDAAAAPESLSLLLVGVVIILPIILAYTAYSFYVFRGKTTRDALY